MLLLRCLWRGAFVGETGLLGSRPEEETWRRAEGIRDWSSKHGSLFLFFLSSSKVWFWSCSSEGGSDDDGEDDDDEERRRTMDDGGR